MRLLKAGDRIRMKGRLIGGWKGSGVVTEGQLRMNDLVVFRKDGETANGRLSGPCVAARNEVSALRAPRKGDDYGVDNLCLVPQKRERYIRFAGETGLRVSRARMALPYCLTRRKADLREPRLSGFDHTTYWRLEGERLCSVVLTEPYPCGGSLMGSVDWPAFAAKHGLLFATGDANLSLWFPGKTAPVLWYRKDAKNKPEITTVLRYFNANIVEALS